MKDVSCFITQSITKPINQFPFVKNITQSTSHSYKILQIQPNKVNLIKAGAKFFKIQIENQNY